MPQQESSKIDFFNTTVLNNLRWFTSPFCFICLCNQIHTTVPVYCICKASFDKLLLRKTSKIYYWFLKLFLTYCYLLECLRELHMVSFNLFTFYHLRLLLKRRTALYGTLQQP